MKSKLLAFRKEDLKTQTDSEVGLTLFYGPENGLDQIVFLKINILWSLKPLHRKDVAEALSISLLLGHSGLEPTLSNPLYISEVSIP
jgi:hypothetical protein